MPKIHKLNESLANKIAAGEVVESPASIVKEMIENSLDANATTIRIKLKAGGKKLIEISDNGEGIPPDEVKIAFERFTTSKIEKESDLWSISTMGFRGEFLASLASVSKVKLSTKTNEAKMGKEVLVQGGTFIQERNIGRSQGTTVTVFDLFYNTPARRKFLKSARAEFACISELVRKYVFPNTHCSFKLFHEEKEILNIPKTKSITNTIIRVLGKKIARNMLKIGAENNNWKITGYISKPIESQKTRRYQFIYVNNRVINSDIVTAALEEGYREKLPPGEFPICILFLSAKKSQAVDVNVHPRKELVRFADENDIFNLISTSVEALLVDKGFISTQKTIESSSLAEHISSTSEKGANDQERTKSVRKIIKQGKGHKQDALVAADSGKYRSTKKGSSDLHFDVSKEIRHVQYGQPLKRKDLRQAEVISSIFETYTLAENDDYLLIVDQDSAAKRIMYDVAKRKERWKKQILLAPVTLELSPEQKDHLEKNFDTIKEMGYKIGIEGENYIVKAVPVIFGKVVGINALEKLIANLDRSPKPLDIIKEEIATIIADMYKRKALSRKEMQDQLKVLSRTGSPFTSPQGIPTVIHISKKEINRQFKK